MARAGLLRAFEKARDVGVAEAGDDRGDEKARGDAGLREFRHRAEARRRQRRGRLKRLRRLVVGEGDGEEDA